MPRIITLATLWSATALAVFMVTEIATVAAAAIWALVGLLDLGRTSAAIVAALIGLPTLYAIVQVTIMAYAAETAPENQADALENTSLSAQHSRMR